MKLIAYLLAFLGVFSGVFAVEVQKSFLVSYPKGTPQTVIDQAKQTVLDAKGIITHEYEFIKGFAATAGEKVMEMVQSMGSEYNAIVEEDKEVHTQG